MEQPTPRERAARKKADRIKRANAPRTRRIVRLRAQGLTYSAIAAEVGLTRQRVHAILRASEAA